MSDTLNVMSTIAEDMIEAKCLHQSMKKEERNALQNGYKLGLVLARIKGKCVAGSWLAKLKELEVNRMTAWRCLKLSECNARYIASCNSVHEAILQNRITEMEEPEKELDGKKPKPVDVAPLCERCRRVGPRKDCKACEEAEVAWRQARKAKGGEREPGDDTDSEQQAKLDDKQKPQPGRIMFEWKATDQNVGSLIRQVDVFGNAYKVKEAPEVDQLRKDLADWHGRFKLVYEKISKQQAPETAA